MIKFIEIIFKKTIIKIKYELFNFLIKHMWIPICLFFISILTWKFSDIDPRFIFHLYFWGQFYLTGIILAIFIYPVSLVREKLVDRAAIFGAVFIAVWCIASVTISAYISFVPLGQLIGSPVFE